MLYQSRLILWVGNTTYRGDYCLTGIVQKPWNRIEPIFVQTKVDLFIELSNNYFTLQQQMSFPQYEQRSSWYRGATVVAVYQMVYLGQFLTIQQEMSLVLQYQFCSSSQQSHCNNYASLKYKDAICQYDDRRDILP